MRPKNMNDPAKTYADLQAGFQTKNPMGTYIAPPRQQQAPRAGCGGGAARRDEDTAFAWWPIVLAVIVAMLSSTGCGQNSGSVLMPMARENEETTSSVTLFSATGDTLYHCDSATNVWHTAAGVSLHCGDKVTTLSGTVVVTDN